MSKLIKLCLITVLVLLGLNSNAQVTSSKTEFEKITETLMHYIEGTANGQPDRLRKAFHPDFNLYTVTEEGKLRIRSGQKYISYFKQDEKTNRIGRIISIDFEKDAATAKVEVLMPGRGIFIDYFLLLKYQGDWKILHKIYTHRDFSDVK